LLDNFVAAMEREFRKLAGVIESCPVHEARDVISLLPSTGGRHAYNITKVQIEQLRETGLNWRAGIAGFLFVLSLDIDNENPISTSIID
jgi:hypothetical protein